MASRIPETNRRGTRKMRGSLKTLCLLASTFAFDSSALLAQEHVATKEIFVHSDDTQCPQASFHSIQEAINLAQPGDIIHVCQGEYAEQLVLKKSLKLIAEPGTVLIPNHMVKSTSSLSGAEPLSAAILVSDTDNVEVRGFTSDGTKNGIDGCAPRLIG